MNCHESTTRIAAYADGEVDAEQARAIRTHLDGCAHCAARHAALLGLRAQLRTELPRHAAPAALRARVLATAHEHRDAARRTGRHPARWRWLAGGALAGCAATVLAWVVGTALLDARLQQDLGVEAVASHVRATQADRLIQVASSDQHTVKPWLSARLDYSPPVPDLQQDGYPLSGGRVDHLDHQPVATLVYRYRNHTIDVFVRPVAHSSSTALQTVRGFNLAHASAADMDWLAVSDVSPAILAAFVERLARAAATP